VSSPIRLSTGLHANLTISVDACVFSSYHASKKGGAISIVFTGFSVDSRFQVTNSSFTHGSSSFGGSIAFTTLSGYEFGSVVVGNCSFSNQATSISGSVYLDLAKSANKVNISVIDSRFTNNSAPSGGAFVALFGTSCEGCALEIDKSLFAKCDSSSHGGGAILVHAVAWLSPVVNIRNCNFTECSAMQAGGAVSLKSKQFQQLTLSVTDSKFLLCSSLDSGGALSIASSSDTDIHTLLELWSIVVRRTEFIDCYATNNGSAVFLSSKYMLNKFYSEWNNVTIQGEVYPPGSFASDPRQSTIYLGCASIVANSNATVNFFNTVIGGVSPTVAICYFDIAQVPIGGDTLKVGLRQTTWVTGMRFIAWSNIAYDQALLGTCDSGFTFSPLGGCTGSVTIAYY
jgi:hypothetical protein